PTRSSDENKIFTRLPAGIYRKLLADTKDRSDILVNALV
ncbi:MAG: hypothetical protein ACJAR0_004151, partial [Candidatus Azotimanducaceae bacterium]